MMPTISTTVSVAANSSSGNVLAGSPFEFLSQDSVVVLAITQAGAAAGNVTMDFQLGGESLTAQGFIPFKATFPSFETDTMVRAGGRGGERLFLNLNNTTAGALVTQVLVEVSPL